ncbi:hypothetical protein HYPSUDRAFT_219569 [Hypholoma sublateritium FD-334 SS-4]|uniref:Uncharacterized protein n=1 Tax=Hypholoma sublateritium (strain FD-334 SS-4) TaxID=945553 RepID=A0A0D2P786_HYPSF|nr:hypothetical protein HYPSUDRAFT_219569 [Hypholoma sublateritium FD-334 SS-4]
MKTAGSSVKPPAKRRRLRRNQARVPGAPSPITTSAPARPLASPTGTSTSKGGIPICATCRRALQNTTAGSIIQCGICFSTTCAICSRTCTNSATSQPPTPHLTFSPSPSPVPSPRRSVLSLNSSNVNLPLMDPPSTLPQFSTSGHRRKHVDDDDLPDSQNALPGEDHGEFGPGCGKFICRNCCYEDAHNNTTTCLECYGSRT